MGLPGAGKSAIAPLLAQRVGFEAVDLDEAVERMAGMTVAAIFETRGEERFRDLEARALAEALDRPRSVVACGGGILVRPENRARLEERAWVAWLTVDPVVAAARLARGATPERPLLRGDPSGAALVALLAERAAAYAAAADVQVPASEGTPDAVAERIAALWEALP